MEKGNIVELKAEASTARIVLRNMAIHGPLMHRVCSMAIRAVRMRSERETFNLGKGRKIHDERWVFLKDDPNFWVKCDADAIERICDANIPTDWLTKDV